MSLFSDAHGDQPYAFKLADLLLVGLRHLEEMAVASRDEIAYATWASLTSQELGEGGVMVSDSQLVWLWDAIRHEPRVLTTIGNLPPAGSLKWNKAERIPVLGSGEWFVIGMKPAEVHGILSHKEFPPAGEQTVVQLLGQLQMRPGKADRLECCDVQAEVTMRPSTIYLASREADITRMPEDDVTVDEKSVRVRVKSLNQAYTVASRRLEPDRRSHGGRVYDHLIHVRPGHRTLLEDIRRRVEAGDWSLGSPPGGNSSNTEAAQ